MHSIPHLLVITIVLVTASCDDVRWNWMCNENKKQCEKTHEKVGLNPTLLPNDWQFIPLQVCRLTCGKYGALWPIPTGETVMQNKLVAINPRNIFYDFTKSNEAIRNYLAEITKIFSDNLDKECGGSCDVDSNFNINIIITTSSKNANLKPDVEESYYLNVSLSDTTVVINVEAASIFGIRHGLETLTQLTASYQTKPDSSGVVQNGLVIISDARIHDKPVYSYRGLLIDTGRNYLTIDAIKRQIDAMAASKLNVLHWHATDSQSFPIESPKVPNLSSYGAYSKDQIYKISDIKNLSEYALYRGIRILMEIDAPSHAGNGWQWGEDANLGSLAVCVNQNPWRHYCIQPPCGQLNPVNPNVYNVLELLYRDLADALPIQYHFHMGGDEVFFECWNSSSEIINYLSKQGKGRKLEDFLGLWSEFQNKALQTLDNIVGNTDTPISMWSSDLTDPDIIEKYLSPKRYIIETWVPGNSDLPAQLLQKGYRLIISTKDAWYLDHGFWGRTVYHGWREVYSNKIPRHSGVLGGEVCMWGEYVDKNNIDGRVWPRAAAAAERLWSDPNLSTANAEIRFYRHRDRLLSRGIGADALAPAWCHQHEGQCQ